VFSALRMVYPGSAVSWNRLQQAKHSTSAKHFVNWDWSVFKNVRKQFMGVGKNFSRGSHSAIFLKFSSGESKVVKFVFSHSELRKQPLFAENFKIQGRADAPVPTPMTQM